MAAADTALRPDPVSNARAAAPASRADRELAGLDALEISGEAPPSPVRRLWSATWPKVGAVAIGLFIWQAVVWSGWRPEYALPPPGRVLGRLWDDLFTTELWK